MKTTLALFCIALAACSPAEIDGGVAGDESALSARNGAIVGLAGKCLNVEGASTADGTRAILWDCVDADNEKWTLSTGNRIIGLGGKCLTATGNWNGAGVTISTCNGSTSQKWSLDANTHIRNLGSNLCLNVYGGYSDSGTPMIVWSCTAGTVDDMPANDLDTSADSDNEKWFVEPNVVLRLQAVFAADSDASHDGPDGSPDWVRMTRDAFGAAVAQANEIYKQAHIKFVWDSTTDWSTVYDTDLNRIACDKSDAWERAGKAEAYGFRFPGKIPVLLRYAGNGGSCSSSPWNSATMVIFRDFSVPSRDPRETGWLLAHELGHYLGLDHPFVDWSDDGNPIEFGPQAGWMARLQDLVTRRGQGWFDADQLSDTPPEPGTNVWRNELGMPTCGGGDSANVGTVTFTPERTNVMSYYACQPDHFSRKQRLRMRRALTHPLRTHLLPPLISSTAPREIFGASGKCLMPDGAYAKVAACTSTSKFTFSSTGQIRYGSSCLTDTSDSTLSARPYFAACSSSTAQRWTRNADGRLTTWAGRSLYSYSDDKVYLGWGTLDPQQIWGSFYPLPAGGPN